MDRSSTTSKVFHVAVLVYYVCVDVHILTNVAPPIMRDIQPIRDGIVILLIQLATFWTLVLQQVFFLCALAEDILEVTSCVDARAKVKKFANVIFVDVLWPFSFVCSITFWVIYAITPRLVDPFFILFDYISWETNHLIHTYICVTIFIEAITTHRPYTKDMISTLKGVTLKLIVYFTVVLVTQPFGEMWTYPFFRDMTLVQWVLYLASTLAVLFAAQFAGWLLNSIVWARSIITSSDFIKSE